MSELRLAAKLYIAALAFAALALTLFTMASAGTPNAERALLAGVFAATIAVMNRFPFHFAFKMNMGLDTCVIIAAVLLFEPGVAVLVAGGGTIIGDAAMRRPWQEVLFNSSQIILQTAVGGLLLASAGWNVDEPRFDRPEHLLMVVIVAGVMRLISTLSVATIIGLQSGLAPLLVWRQSTTRFDHLESLSQVALGLMAAALVDVYPLLLPFLVFPVGVVYLSLQRHARLRQQTVNAVESLADIVDLRDPYTANHSRRVAIYARELATAIGLSPNEVDVIELAGRVHDVGKIIVDREVLSKEARLNDEEWEQIKRHPVTGALVLARFPEFALATSYVRHHHESLDGRGYPDGLQGEKIPLGARILAVADSFDAMSSARPYRRALAPEIVLGEFEKKRGIQWDAQVVDALLDLIAAGRITFPDGAAGPQMMDRYGTPIPLPVAS